MRSIAFTIFALLGLIVNAALTVMFGWHYGTGKSTLMRHLAGKLAEVDNTKVIFVDPQDLEMLRNPKFRSQLDRIFNYQQHNILIIDQAEEAMLPESKVARLLLDLTDGQLSEEYNVSIIGAYNGDRREFDPGFFRAKRFVPIDLMPLDKATADKAVKVMKKAMDEGEVFNHDLYMEILQSENLYPDGQVYAEQGEITLADVSQCVEQKSSADMFNALLENPTSNKGKGNSKAKSGGIQRRRNRKK